MNPKQEMVFWRKYDCSYPQNIRYALASAQKTFEVKINYMILDEQNFLADMINFTHTYRIVISSVWIWQKK